MENEPTYWYITCSVTKALEWLSAGVILDPEYLDDLPRVPQEGQEIFFRTSIIDLPNHRLDICTEVNCFPQTSISDFTESLKTVQYSRLDCVSWEETLRLVLVDVPMADFAPEGDVQYVDVGVVTTDLEYQ